METIIVKQNGSEVVNADLKFRVVMGTTIEKRYDQFIYDTYSEAKDRIVVLKAIFKSYIYDIIIIEE